MALTEIGSIELLGEKYKLGKNGKVCLVRTETDAWGNSYGKEVPLKEWLSVGQESACQALLDALGDALSRLRQQRDARLSVGDNKELSQGK